MRVWLSLGVLVLLLAPTARALETGKYRYDPKGRVRAVRAIDVNGDRRTDLVLFVDPPSGSGGIGTILVLRTPERPAQGTFWNPADVIGFPQGGTEGHRAGGVAVGRFGPNGEVRLRLLAPQGLVDMDPGGAVLPEDPRLAVPTLLGRSAGRPIAVWDAHADLDGDGVEEIWFPAGDATGSIRLLPGKAGPARTLALASKDAGSSTYEAPITRTTKVPNLFAADLDGDRVRDLVALDGKDLVGWDARAALPPDGAPIPPSFRLPLPFLEEPPLGPEEIRTPRIQLEDVDADGVTDLLVTLVKGRHDQLGSLRTSLFHFPGPFRDRATGALVQPRTRIDTESVALHPRFVDVDGDGDLDYVGDSIRGGQADLLKRVMGAEPEITFVGFRFDRAAKTFESTPYFTVARPYATAQAVSNTFGISGWFADFDGDGHKDLVDLGNLQGLEILGAVRKRGSGPGDPVAFTGEWMRRVQVPKPLDPQAVIGDLTGDGRPELVTWNEDTVFLVVPAGTR